MFWCRLAVFQQLGGDSLADSGSLMPSRGRAQMSLVCFLVRAQDIESELAPIATATHFQLKGTAIALRIAPECRPPGRNVMAPTEPRAKYAEAS